MARVQPYTPAFAYGSITRCRAGLLPCRARLPAAIAPTCNCCAYARANNGCAYRHTAPRATCSYACACLSFSSVCVLLYYPTGYSLTFSGPRAARAAPVPQRTAMARALRDATPHFARSGWTGVGCALLYLAQHAARAQLLCCGWFLKHNILYNNIRACATILPLLYAVCAACAGLPRHTAISYLPALTVTGSAAWRALTFSVPPAAIATVSPLGHFSAARCYTFCLRLPAVPHGSLAIPPPALLPAFRAAARAATHYIMPASAGWRYAMYSVPSRCLAVSSGVPSFSRRAAWH